MTTITVSSGIISSGSVASGSTEFVLSGGSTTGVIVSGGGTQIISSGASVGSSTLRGITGSAAYLFVQSGAKSQGTIISSGGSEVISAGGSGYGTSVYSGGADTILGTMTAANVYAGGSLVVSSGGIAISSVVASGGAETVSSGGIARTTVISSGGTEMVLSGGIESGSIVSSGGTETIASGGIVSGGTVAGGLLDIQSGAIVSGAVTFTTAVGRLEVDGTTMPTNTISGFSVNGDGILLGGVAYSSAETFSVSGNVVTISSGTSTYALTVSGAVASSLKLVNDGNLTELVFATCFLRGTRIATPSGERAIEELVAGEAVSVLVDDDIVSRPIQWIGRRSVTPGDFARSSDGHPVRVRRSAFADNVPSRDLLVTPEHCVLVDGGLIPVRMLVNGRSIISDSSIGSYEFFHIELETHGIVLAEGLATESYLDTGNRGVFDEERTAVSGAPVMAAPLSVDRSIVQPIWQDLSARAMHLGFELIMEQTTCVEQEAHAGVRLLLDDGREVAPRWNEGLRQMFHIPRGARPLRLLSNAISPAEAIGPFCDDRRQLGIAVKSIVFWNGLNATKVGHDLLTCGWHAPEGHCRWTNGNAELQLPYAEHADSFVDIELAMVAHDLKLERLVA